MATYITHPQTSTSPAEYGSTNLVVCAGCGAHWDLDEDAGDGYDLVDGLPYCTESMSRCFQDASDKAFRREATLVLRDGIKELLEKLDDLTKQYDDNNCEQDQAHPYNMLEDLDNRVQAFGEGRDSGWRNGLMMSSGERYDVIMPIKSAISSQSFDLLWDLGLTESHPLCKVSPAMAGFRAQKIANLGKAVLKLQEAETRTEKGGR